MIKTTKAHFAIFKKEVNRLLELYGLVGYEHHIEHMKLGPEIMSGVTVAFPARQITVFLNKEWEEDTIPTTDIIKECAFHEVLEALFYRLESFTQKVYKEEAREEVHAIIQTLINVKRGE